MLMDNPTLKLSISSNDIPGILKAVLKEKHWRNFQVASVKLVYVPHWFFNFDMYFESQEGIQTYSSQMALDAVTGKLNPIIVEILKEIPVEKIREISGGEVEKPTIGKDELKEVAKIKMAGELKIPKDKLTIYGANLTYVPVYRAWVSLGKRIVRIDIDGISGSPINVQDVPEKERGIIEVTADMIEDLKTPEGWIDYSKKAGDWISEVAKSTGGAVAKQVKSGAVKWLFTTKPGQYTILTLVVLALLYLVLKKYGIIT